MRFKIDMYETRLGRIPYLEWFERLDKRSRFIVAAYLDRVGLGAARNNIRGVGEGVFEVRVFHGPGYRIYFGRVGDRILVLLLGGDKGSQARDIERAKAYWKDYAQKQIL